MKPQLCSVPNTFDQKKYQFQTQAMIPQSQHFRRKHLQPLSPAVCERALVLHTFPPERHTGNLVRRRGGLISIPMKFWPAPETHRLMTKLLLNVTIERSLGPVKVVMSPENTVRDLIKAVVEIYVREKRRPFVKETDPQRFELHYSQFSLESLKGDKKLIKLRSRNFFLCNSKSKPSVNPSNCSEKADKAINSLFPWIKFMDFLL